MLILRVVVWMSSIGMVVAGVGAVSGQDYPNKPIRLVTTAAGSGSDVTSRVLAQGVSGPLGQPVIVDNRGTGVIPAGFASKAPPDGYTLLVNGNSLWTFPLLQKTLYDVVRDFSPITLIEMSVNVVVVNPSVPAKSVKGLIALAKARPGELNYGSTVAGSSSHLAAELFKYMAGVNIVHVPYKGMGPALTDLIGGRVQLVVGSATVMAPHLKSGSLTGLAVTSAAPSALFPELPTVAATVPGYESVGMTGVFAPAKTPEAVIKRLNQEMVRFLKTAEAKEKFFGLGAEAVGNLPPELAAAVKAETGRLDKLIKEIGIRAD